MPPVKLKRGGPHNRGDRPTWQLTEQQCRNVIARSFDAWDAGQPLSRFITLAWGKAGIDGDGATMATGQFIKMAREWMRSHGYPVTPWVWVQETGDTFGQHAHILLYVPTELEDLFSPMPRRWGKAIAGGTYARGLVISKQLQGAKSASINPGAYEAQLMGRLAYLLKNAPEEWAEPLGLKFYISKPWGQSSKVIGRRASQWQTRKKQGVG
jgi:hypothetical protein